MGGDVDWQALDLLAAYYQVENADLLIGALIQLKEYSDKLEAAKSR